MTEWSYYEKSGFALFLKQSLWKVLKSKTFFYIRNTESYAKWSYFFIRLERYLTFVYPFFILKIFYKFLVTSVILNKQNLY